MRRSESPDHHRIGGHEPDRPTSDHQGSIRVWDCGSPLYDSYELAAVNHLLERHMMILTPSHGSTETVTATPSEKARPGPGMESAGQKQVRCPLQRQRRRPDRWGGDCGRDSRQGEGTTETTTTTTVERRKEFGRFCRRSSVPGVVMRCRETNKPIVTETCTRSQ